MQFGSQILVLTLACHRQAALLAAAAAAGRPQSIHTYLPLCDMIAWIGPNHLALIAIEKFAAPAAPLCGTNLISELTISTARCTRLEFHSNGLISRITLYREMRVRHVETYRRYCQLDMFFSAEVTQSIYQRMFFSRCGIGICTASDDMRSILCAKGNIFICTHSSCDQKLSLHDEFKAKGGISRRQHNKACAAQ
jgi:hypothetical protein